MKIIRFNNFLNEKAVSADEVLTNEPDTAVIKIDKKKPLKESIKLILYNFKKNKIEGFIALERFKGDNEFIISKSYAIDKHGPLMYELALSAISPSGIIPDRTIRPAAQKVWEYFDKNRPDVKKTEMTSEHDWYAEEFDIDIEHEHLKTPEVLNLINKIYHVESPLKNTKELLQKGISLAEQNHINPTELLKQAEADFRSVYNTEL